MCNSLYPSSGGCGACVCPDCDALDVSCSQCGVRLSVIDKPTDPRDPWVCADCLRAATGDWLDRWDYLSPVRTRSENVAPDWKGSV